MQFAGDHQARMDSDPDRDRFPGRIGGTGSEPRRLVDQLERCVDRARGIVLVGPRVAEREHDAVAGIVDDGAAVAQSDACGGFPVGDQNVAQILGVEALRQRCRADHVAEHQRELPTLAGGI